MAIDIQKVDKILERTTQNKHIHEAVLHIENADGDISYSNGYGGKDIDTPLLMASITKLFTTTCIFMLKEQGKLSLDHQATTYFQKDTLDRLHIYKGKDFSDILTLRHLLYHTSGLPDAIDEGSHEAKKRVLHQDKEISFEETIIQTKQLPAHFSPVSGKRAHYANVNFDILGKIIEMVTGAPLEDVYKQYIFEPLGLKHTYLPKDKDDFVPNVYYKDTSFHRPKLLRSIRASGGCISTAREMMLFIKAFYGGELFNQSIFQKLDVNNRLQISMSPIHYGAGYMRVPLNGIATLFLGRGELIGHSGSTGSFTFYYPHKDLFFTGDVNQMANPALPVRLAMQLAMSVK